MMILRVFLTLIIEQTITHMKALFTILFCLFVTVSCQTNAESNDNSKPIVIYRGKANKTLVDIANDLLEFGKYEMALELVKNDTGALGIKMCANYGLGKIQDAIDYAVGELDAEVVTFTAFLAELIRDKKITVKNSGLEFTPQDSPILARDLEEAGNVVLGASFIDDLTETYEKDYIELLESKKYEKLRDFGEQVC